MKAGLAVGLALATLMATPAAMAQRDERIVVTGSRIDRDGGSIPVISMRVPAEFVIFMIEVETTTRSVDARAVELEKAFNAIRDKVKRTPGLTLEVGDAFTAIPIETVAVREIIEPDQEDDLRSEIRLVLTSEVKAGDTFEKIRARIDQFVKELPQQGRTEIVIGSNQFMGVNDPMKHREALLRKIAADTELLQSLFGRGATGPAALSLTGLEGRVQSRPVAPLVLELYLNYDLSLVQAPQMSVRN